MKFYSGSSSSNTCALIMQLSVSIIYARICNNINDDVRMGISLTYPTMTARSRGRLHSSLTWGATARISRTPRTWALNRALLRSITHIGHMTSSKSQLMDTWSQQEVDMLTRYTIKSFVCVGLYCFYIWDNFSQGNNPICSFI